MKKDCQTVSCATPTSMNCKSCKKITYSDTVPCAVAMILNNALSSDTLYCTGLILINALSSGTLYCTMILINALSSSERDSSPRMALPGTPEFDFGMRWKNLYDAETRVREEVEGQLKEQRRILEVDTDQFHHYEHATLIRQRKLFINGVGVCTLLITIVYGPA